MVYDNPTTLSGAICFVSVAVHLISEWRKWQIARSISKLVASTSFVALAVVNGANDSSYGRFILLALIFSWLGDVLLLSLRQ